jgi:hypothetical protein
MKVNLKSYMFCRRHSVENYRQAEKLSMRIQTTHMLASVCINSPRLTCNKLLVDEFDDDAADLNIRIEFKSTR